MIIPLTRVIPMLFRAPAPGPCAKTSGRWPKTVAALVIRIGRSRVVAASITACSLSAPPSWAWLANCTMSTPLRATSPTRVMSPTCE